MAFKFLSCCCSNTNDELQVQMDPNDERAGYSHSHGGQSEASPAMSSGRGREGVPFSNPTSPAPLKLLSSSSPPPAPVPMMGGSFGGDYGLPMPPQMPEAAGARPKDKAEEKAKLQELVKIFAKRATKGVSCSFLNSTSGLVSPARYFLEKDLRELRVKVDGMPDVTCLISEVADIVKLEGSDGSCVPPDLVPMLSDSMRSKLLVISLKDKQLLLLEASREDADTFFISMRVLRLYCQQQDMMPVNNAGYS